MIHVAGTKGKVVIFSFSTLLDCLLWFWCFFLPGIDLFVCRINTAKLWIPHWFIYFSSFDWCQREVHVGRVSLLWNLKQTKFSLTNFRILSLSSFFYPHIPALKYLKTSFSNTSGGVGRSWRYVHMNVILISKWITICFMFRWWFPLLVYNSTCFLYHFNPTLFLVDFFI